MAQNRFTVVLVGKQENIGIAERRRHGELSAFLDLFSVTECIGVIAAIQVIAHKYGLNGLLINTSLFRPALVRKVLDAVFQLRNNKFADRPHIGARQQSLLRCFQHVRKEWEIPVLLRFPEIDHRADGPHLGLVLVLRFCRSPFHVSLVLKIFIAGANIQEGKEIDAYIAGLCIAVGKEFVAFPAEIVEQVVGSRVPVHHVVAPVNRFELVVAAHHCQVSVVLCLPECSGRQRICRIPVEEIGTARHQDRQNQYKIDQKFFHFVHL